MMTFRVERHWKDSKGGKPLDLHEKMKSYPDFPGFHQAKARQFLKPGSIATVHTSRAQSARALLGNLNQTVDGPRYCCTSWYGKHSHCQVGQDFWNINRSIFKGCIFKVPAIWKALCSLFGSEVYCLVGQVHQKSQAPSPMATHGRQLDHGWTGLRCSGVSTHVNWLVSCSRL